MKHAAMFGLYLTVAALAALPAANAEPGLQPPVIGAARPCGDRSCPDQVSSSSLLDRCAALSSRASWASDWTCSNVAIYNGDDRRSIADNDDPRIDALSDAIGVASVCNRTFSAVLTKRKGDPTDYVILPAHSFFDRQGKPVLNKEGEPCGEEEMARAEYYPNMKYLYLGSDRGFAMRKVAVSWPPINLEAGREWGTMGEDVLIFRIDKPAEGYLSDDLMPSGRRRGYLKYFSYSDGGVDASRFGRLARIAFSKDSPRPLEQLVQTTAIVARFANAMVYDNSDTWVISSGSPLLGELDGQTAILGHISTAAGDRNGQHERQPPKIDKPIDDLELRDWNRNIPGATLARKYGLAAIPVE